MSLDFDGRASDSAAPPCVEDANCPVRQLCVKGVCLDGCRSASDCPAGEVCDPGPPSRCTSAFECRADPDCPASAPRCHPSLGVCVSCLTTEDCGLEEVCLIEPDCYYGREACTREDYQCGLCTEDAQCAVGSCDVASGRCVECTSDADCGGGLVCDLSAGLCAQCNSNADCAEPRPACLLGPTGGECVRCAQDADCGEGTCDRDTLSCVGCLVDSDCRGEGLRCNPSSGLCYDPSCAKGEGAVLFELVVEASFEVEGLSGAPAVGPLVGVPGPQTPPALVVPAAPGPGGAPTLYALSDGGRASLWAAGSQQGGAAGVALGDLDGDGAPEIVAVRDGRLVALDAFGSPQWTSGTRTPHWPSLFDVDGDGFAEVVAGGSLYSEVGARVWAGSAHQGAPAGLGLPGLGVAAELRPQRAGLEIVAGGAVYAADGEPLCTQGEDGYSALGDLDGDGAPELVVVSGDGSARALSPDCELLWGPAGDNQGAQGGGPPTLADLDGDGRPEVVYVAREDRLRAVSSSGAPLWEADLDGAHPHAALAVADLNADGLPEVLVSDGQGLLIHARDGQRLTLAPEGASRLPAAGPIVADVDGDGSAEIAVSSAGLGGAGRVVVLGDVRGRWAQARNLWNQTTYASAAIRDDLRVPVAPGAWWAGASPQRAQATGAAADPAPNLRLRRLPGAVDLAECPDRFTLAVGLYNRGARAVPEGVPVVVRGVERGVDLLRATSTRKLDPGEEEVLLLTLADFVGLLDVDVLVDRSPEDALESPECDEADNALRLEQVGCPLTP